LINRLDAVLENPTQEETLEDSIESIPPEKVPAIHKAEGIKEKVTYE